MVRSAAPLSASMRRTGEGDGELAWVCAGPDGCDDLIVLALVAIAVVVALAAATFGAGGCALVWRQERQRGLPSRRARIGWFVMGGTLSTVGIGLLGLAALSISTGFVGVMVAAVANFVWAWWERRALLRSRSAA